MMNALRLKNGFATELFSLHTGQPITLVEAPLKSAEASGLIGWTSTNIQPTEKGRRFLNDLLGLFVED
jgi:oxygen-independent coproporphyrinogen-3 oxidase